MFTSSPCQNAPSWKLLNIRLTIVEEKMGDFVVSTAIIVIISHFVLHLYFANGAGTNCILELHRQRNVQAVLVDSLVYLVTLQGFINGCTPTQIRVRHQ